MEAELTQRTRDCSVGGRELSMGRRPVMISSSSTPKAYTSVRGVGCDDHASSGAAVPAATA